MELRSAAGAGARSRGVLGDSLNSACPARTPPGPRPRGATAAHACHPLQPVAWPTERASPDRLLICSGLCGGAQSSMERSNPACLTSAPCGAAQRLRLPCSSGAAPARTTPTLLYP
eukprot:scaffold3296_cov405-Prasinococcus_capsulatus_cf.AAC.12